MTVSNPQIRVSYTGDGVTTAFPIPYPFYLATDIEVLLAGVQQGSGYAISGGEDASGNPQTGTCTFSTAPGSGVNVQLILNVPLSQLVQLVDGTAFPSATVNQVNDRAIQAALRLNDLISRSIRAPDGDTTPLMLLPNAASRASTMLTFDGNGNILPAPQPVAGSVTQALIGNLLYPRTGAEVSASVTPANYAYPEGYLERYGGTVGNNCDTALAAAISVMTAKGGGTIYALSVGSYSFANTYAFPASTGIQGNGYGTKLQYTGSGSFLTFGHTSSRAWLANLQVLGTSQTGVGLTLGDTTANGGFCKLTGVLFSGWATAMRMGGATWLTCEKCEFGNAAGGVGVITNNVGIDFNYFGGNNYSSGLTFKDCVISNNANAGVQATNVSVTMNGVAWINCTVQNNCQSATGNPQFYMGNVIGFVIDTLYMEYTLGGTNPDALKASNLNNGQIRSIFINGAANGIKDDGGAAVNHVEIIGAQIFNITTGDAVNCAGETDVRLRCSSITGTVVLTGTGCEVLSSNFLTASWPVNETNFTPVLTPASGAITQTGQGTYSQVGNTVNFTLRIDWSSLNTGSGALTITGFPVAPKSGLKDVGFSVGYFNGITLASGQQLLCYIPNGSTMATLYFGGATTTGATVAQLATSGSIIVSGSYQV